MALETAPNSTKKKLSANEFFAMASRLRKIKPFDLKPVVPAGQSDTSEDDEEDDVVRIQPFHGEIRKSILGPAFDRYKPVSKRKSEDVSFGNDATAETSSANEKPRKFLVSSQTSENSQGKGNNEITSSIASKSALELNPKDVGYVRDNELQISESDCKVENGRIKVNDTKMLTAYPGVKADIKMEFIKNEEQNYKQSIVNDPKHMPVPVSSLDVAPIANVKHPFAPGSTYVERKPACKNNIHEPEIRVVDTELFNAQENQWHTDFSNRSDCSRYYTSIDAHVFSKPRSSTGIKSTDSGFSSSVGSCSSLSSTLFPVDSRSVLSTEESFDPKAASRSSVTKPSSSKLQCFSSSSLSNKDYGKSRLFPLGANKENINCNLSFSNDKNKAVKLSMDSSTTRDDSGMQSFTDVFSENGSFSEWNKITDPNISKDLGVLKTSNPLYSGGEKTHPHSKSLTTTETNVDTVPRKTQSQSKMCFIPKLKNSSAQGKSVFLNSQQAIPYLLLPSHVILQGTGNSNEQKLNALVKEEALELSNRTNTLTYEKPSKHVDSAISESTSSIAPQCGSIPAAINPSIEGFQLRTSESLSSVINVPSHLSQIQPFRDMPVKTSAIPPHPHRTKEEPQASSSLDSKSNVTNEVSSSTHEVSARVSACTSHGSAQSTGTLTSSLNHSVELLSNSKQDVKQSSFKPKKELPMLKLQGQSTPFEDVRSSNKINNFLDNFKASRPIDDIKSNVLVNNIKTEYPQGISKLAESQVQNANNVPKKPSIGSESNSTFTSPPKSKSEENLEQLLLRSKSKSKTITVRGEIYNKQKCIGKGGSAKVFEAVNSNGESFAIKVVQFADVEDEIAKSYLNEVNLLRQMKGCPYVVQLHEYELRDEDLYIVMERGDFDLDHIIKTKKKLETEEVISYWAQMLFAVNAIHAAGIIHLDLKPSNFLIVKNKLKLIDFGIANKIQSDVTSITRHTQAGTVNYMAPEQLSNAKDPSLRRLSPKTDVWSLACILYYMVYQTLPYKHIRNECEKILAIKSGKPINFPDNGKSEMIDVLKACLSFQPKQRPSIEVLLKHPCVKAFETRTDDSYQALPKTPIRKFARHIKSNAINSPMAIAKIDKSIFSRRTQLQDKFPGSSES